MYKYAFNEPGGAAAAAAAPPPKTVAALAFKVQKVDDGDQLMCVAAIELMLNYIFSLVLAEKPGRKPNVIELRQWWTITGQLSPSEEEDSPDVKQMIKAFKDFNGPKTGWNPEFYRSNDIFMVWVMEYCDEMLQTYISRLSNQVQIPSEDKMKTVRELLSILTQVRTILNLSDGPGEC